MTATAKKILEDALTLPEADRRRVAETLLDSVPRDAADDTERLWSEEALRRAAAVERGEIATLDGETATVGVRDRFTALVQEWRRNTRVHSSWHKRTQHPAYLRIIGLGPAVLPHLIRENCQRPDDWNWALTAITGAQPAANAEDRAAAAHAWRDWAVGAGILRDDEAR